jgi:hypothetical protein
VVIKGIRCSVTRDQLRQFDAEATALGISREQAAATYLTEEIAEGREKQRQRDLIRRSASDTQAHKEYLARLREKADANGFDWKRDYAYLCTARADAVADLEDLENLFAVTGNGRCAWRALRIARENRLLVPQWVSKYLYDFAVGLDKFRWGKQSAVKIAEELKLHTSGGQSSAVARFKSQRIRFYVASYMDGLIQRHHQGHATAAKQAADEASLYLPRAVSASTVKKWYREFKDAVGRHTESMSQYRRQVLDGWPVHPHPYAVDRLPAEHRIPIE